MTALAELREERDACAALVADNADEIERILRNSLVKTELDWDRLYKVESPFLPAPRWLTRRGDGEWFVQALKPTLLGFYDDISGPLNSEDEAFEFVAEELIEHWYRTHDETGRME